jgi:hypothetical protein
MLNLEADVFTIDGSLTLANRGISVAANGRLVQNGDLEISVNDFLGAGVRLAAGASWLQLGRTTINAGVAGSHAQLSLGAYHSRPHYSTPRPQSLTVNVNSLWRGAGGQRNLGTAWSVASPRARLDRYAATIATEWAWRKD